jgi:hypothetical protein
MLGDVKPAGSCEDEGGEDEALYHHLCCLVSLHSTAFFCFVFVAWGNTAFPAFSNLVNRHFSLDGFIRMHPDEYPYFSSRGGKEA